MQYPLVSAIVLCYNHAKYVVECLENVKAQNYPNLELIINDDASRDESAAVIERWLAGSGLRHRFLKNAQNQGVCRSLNNALSQARGKYISGIAADDVWLPGKLVSQVELMERLPAKCGVVYSDALQMDERGKLLPQTFLEQHGSFEQMPQGNIHTILWGDNFIPAMTTLIKRECFDKVGLYDETLYYEDWDMWLRISRCFDFVFSEQVSAKYRYVPTSMMRSQADRILDAGCQVCVKHLREGKLEREARRAAVSLLQRKAATSFQWKTPAHKQNLWQAFRYGPSCGMLARLLFTWCGLGTAQFERLRSVVCRPQLQQANL